MPVTEVSNTLLLKVIVAGFPKLFAPAIFSTPLLIERVPAENPVLFPDRTSVPVPVLVKDDVPLIAPDNVVVPVST